jgi:hypothetical protein
LDALKAAKRDADADVREGATASLASLNPAAPAHPNAAHPNPGAPGRPRAKN